MTVNTDRLSPELTAYIKTLQAENDALQSKNEESQKELLLLKAQNSKLEKQVSSLTEIIVNNRKKMFGKSSEQMKYVDSAEQLTLFNEAEKESDAAAEEPTKETLVAAHKRKAKRTKKELTEDLRHVKEVIKLEEPVCEICGGELIPIGEEFVRSELNIIPAQIFVIDYYREVYKCENCADDEYTSITKAEVSPSVMKKSMASAGTVAYVMQQKYQLGVPLYRQEQYWKAEGVDLRRNTLANWIIRSSRWFIPLWDRMKALMLTEDILHADETPLRVLKRNGQQTDSTSRMWVFCTGKDSAIKMSLYFYHPTRSGAVVKQVVGNYSGYLQTDGCASYNKAENAVQVGCWAHARRKWTDCASGGIKLEGSNTAQALDLISQIFAADKGLEGLPDEEKLKAKQEKVKPLIDKYWHLLENINPEGNSGLKKAVVYSLNQRNNLNNYLLDPRLELTNNRAERAVKPFVIGRKNWLFSDTDKGAEASARCYSIIEGAKLNNLDIFAYLTYLLTELPKLGENPVAEQIDRFLPWSRDLPEYCNKKINTP